jgi:hypothetical protein
MWSLLEPNLPELTLNNHSAAILDSRFCNLANYGADYNRPDMMADVASV